MRGELKFVFGMFLLVLLLGFVSAGVGIKWSKESTLVPENTKTCLTYSVYNPFDKDSNVQIDLSDSLQSIIVSAESETKFVPAGTSSDDAIPVEFCFKTPQIYERDCLLFDSLICKQECKEDMKIFSGEVEVLEAPLSELEGGDGAGGSTTALSASAPLRVKVKCVPYERNYSVIYILIALIAGILLAISFLQEKKKRKTRKKHLRRKKRKSKKKRR